MARNVESLRRAQGLSQQQVADRMGELGRPVAMSAVSKIEKGQRRVDPDDLVALAIALNVNPSRLLLNDGNLDEELPLTPTRSAPRWAAWQWADGVAPLVSGPGDETSPHNTVEEYERFERFARPTELRRLEQLPLVRAARVLFARSLRLIQGDLARSNIVRILKMDVEAVELELRRLGDEDA